MTVLQAIELGVLQAATEFLPVSSSGHLVLYRVVTGRSTEGHLLFDVMLHVGTLAAVLAVYGRDVLHLILAVLGAAAGRLRGETWRTLWQRDADLRLAVWLAVATVPAVVVSLLLGRTIGRVGDHTGVVALLLILNGWVLFFAGRQRVRDRPLTAGRSLTIGVAQAVALLPGISRSGMTISAGLAAGRNRREAARFSFLLSVPAILGAAAMTLTDSAGAATTQPGAAPVGPVLIGMLVSAVVGYGALRLLLRVLQRGRLGLFAYYCWLAGLAVIIWEKVL